MITRTHRDPRDAARVRERERERERSRAGEMRTHVRTPYATHSYTSPLELVSKRGAPTGGAPHLGVPRRGGAVATAPFLPRHHRHGCRQGEQLPQQRRRQRLRRRLRATSSATRRRRRTDYNSAAAASTATGGSSSWRQRARQRWTASLPKVPLPLIERTTPPPPGILSCTPTPGSPT